jgi:lipopolysaccharide transport system ATP-binding protein
MNRAPVIRLEEVSKYYKLYDSPRDRLKEALHPRGKTYHRDYYALRNINLEVQSGEILGVVGRNGCGKSTLLKLICSILTPSSGALRVDGKVSALLELSAGFNPEFTGRQNIYFLGTIIGVPKQDLQLRLGDIIAFADIGEFIDQPLKTYSSGMKARLGFAVATHIDPDILVIDEVLAVGDDMFKRKCYAKMNEFFQGGKTVIYVSHETSSINRLCSRAVLLDNGEIILDCDSATVTKFYLKYLHATGKNKIAVREEIRNATATAPGPVARAREKAEKKTSADATRREPQSAFYIPDFRPKSTLEYQNKAIRIYGARIVDTNNRQVNVLTHGEEYQYVVHYKSELRNPVYDVAFGMEIKDHKGFRISSIESNLSYRNRLFAAHMSAGQQITATFTFCCLFAPGLYFVDSGVSSYASGEQEVLNRLVDVLCFKVQDPADRLFGGLVNAFRSVRISAGADAIVERALVD